VPICGLAGQAPILSGACPIAGFQVLTSQGDFLCYRGESPGSGDDPAAPLLHAFHLALQSLFAPHRCAGLCPFRCDSRRRVLEHGHEPIGLVLAGRQQIT
jgi:hypothetical protein